MIDRSLIDHPRHRRPRACNGAATNRTASKYAAIPPLAQTARRNRAGKVDAMSVNENLDSVQRHNMIVDAAVHGLNTPLLIRPDASRGAAMSASELRSPGGRSNAEETG